MKIYIGETNIILDLIELEILPEFFSLQAEFYTTQFIIGSLSNPNHTFKVSKYVDSGQLTVHELSHVEIAEVSNWKITPHLIRISERSVLWKIYKTGGIILNGNPKMHKGIQVESIQAHGTDWIIGQLAKAEIICAAQSMNLHRELKRIQSVIHNIKGIR